jgi:hypothetical protein
MHCREQRYGRRGVYGATKMSGKNTDISNGTITRIIPEGKNLSPAIPLTHLTMPGVRCFKG